MPPAKSRLDPDHQFPKVSAGKSAVAAPEIEIGQLGRGGVVLAHTRTYMLHRLLAGMACY